MSILKNKTIVVGVSGSIAAHKSATLVSQLLKMGADVHVIMTENATRFITPLTFSTYTGHKTLVDTFDEDFEYKVEHISIAQLADLVVLAPATANLIAKIAHGIADDMLTTTVLATKAPILVFPAMNTNMYENTATKENINTLRSRGIDVINPDYGMLACGTEGAGRMLDPEVIAEYIALKCAREKLLCEKKVLIGAGPTKEAIDPVRFISNHSSGKMGYSMAREAARMGAKVTLVSGPTNLETPLGVERLDVISAKDMLNAIENHAKEADVIAMPAAVADFTPQEPANEKIKKKDTKDSYIKLDRTEDILARIVANKRNGQIICGFSMETENLVENSMKKLKKKGTDMIVANHLRTTGAGFNTDTNIVFIITKDGIEELPIMSKDDVSHNILLRLAKLMD